MLRGKTLLTLTALLMTAPAFAEVSVETRNCGTGYGPDAKNLSVFSDSSEGFVALGYSTAGLFFQMEVENCKTLRLDNSSLLCDGQVVGKVGKFQITEDGEPVASLAITSNVEVVISGSCKSSDRSPLTLSFR